MPRPKFEIQKRRLFFEDIKHIIGHDNSSKNDQSSLYNHEKFNKDPSKWNLFILGHDSASDLGQLHKAKIDLEKHFNVVEVLDTQEHESCVGGLASCLETQGLATVMSNGNLKSWSLDGEHQVGHTGVTDAVLTLQLFLAQLAQPDAGQKWGPRHPGMSTPLRNCYILSLDCEWINFGRQVGEKITQIGANIVDTGMLIDNPREQWKDLVIGPPEDERHYWILKRGQLGKYSHYTLRPDENNLPPWAIRDYIANNDRQMEETLLNWIHSWMAVPLPSSVNAPSPPVAPTTTPTPQTTTQAPQPTASVTHASGSTVVASTSTNLPQAATAQAPAQPVARTWASVAASAAAKPHKGAKR